jgi:peptidase E
MKQIIALGGGGFSMEPDNLALDRYIIAQTGKSNPKICFIPTASAESADYIVNFYAAFNKLGCHATHLSLFRLPQADLEGFIMEQDAIYVGGGNTRSMLALWRAWKLDEILRKAWGEGVLLAGISAGAICWFEQGVTDSMPGELGTLDCLGFLRGSCCPHYDGEENRRPEFQRLLSEGKIHPGYALDDGVALHYRAEKPEKIVSSRPTAQAYRLEIVAGEVQERVLEAHFLGET